MASNSFQSSAFSFHEASNEINMTPSQSDTSVYTPIIETERVRLIWGTTINIQETSDLFKEHIRKQDNYLNIFENINLTQDFCFIIDCSTLDSVLCHQIQSYPTEVLPILENTLQDIYLEYYPLSKSNIKIRLINIGKEVNIRNINPRDIDKLIKVIGLVIRSSGVIPELSKGCFVCVQCNRQVEVESIKNVINQPTICECGGRHTTILRHNKGLYDDKQTVKIQELSENIPDGTTPLTLTLVVRDDMVDKLIPGDKVEITGILQAVPVRLNSTTKKIKSTFRTYVELISFNIKNKAYEKTNWVDEIDKLKNRPDLYNYLAKSIAPSVYGMENVKKALLLQLFGGVRKEKENVRLRGDINILLAGDPGISKSQLLGFINRISERGLYTSGKGSSAVGLTASVSRDPDSGQYVLESGALVLSDSGICCIDEFDKMSDSTRSVLHEVMEQQTVSVAKAGIITTLNARCSILASCNPIESKYNPRKNIIENINLPPTLLSRFDVVCLLIDKYDEERDLEVGRHIVGMYSVMEEEEYININLLKAYIKEAKRIIPKLTDEGSQALTKAYVDLRQIDNGNTITATTRQLESLIRLSEAHARMRFSKEVTPYDVNEALRIIKESLLMYAIDPITGKIDMDMVISGVSASKKKLMEDLRESVIKIVKRRNCSFESLVSETKGDERMVYDCIKELVDEGVIFKSGGEYEFIRK